MTSFTEQHDTSASSDFEENLAILREITFFSALPLEMLKVLAYLGTREEVQAGEYLLRKNDDDGQAVYIMSGQARLLHEEGGRQIEIRQYDTRSFLGSLALLGRCQRLFSLQARTDMTCLIITRQHFATVMEKFPGSAPRVFQAMVHGISAWERSLLDSLETDCDACRRRVGVTLL